MWTEFQLEPSFERRSHAGWINCFDQIEFGIWVGDCSGELRFLADLVFVFSDRDMVYYLIVIFP